MFADDTARCSGAGIRVRPPAAAGATPLLAFAVRLRAAGAGVMVTASHNPAADNGYKLYLAEGAQIVAPVDAAIAGRIEPLGPTGRDPTSSRTLR